MGRGKDIFCYRYVFAIDPGYSFRNGAGYAIFDPETLKLIACGIVRPFAPGLSNQNALDDITNKIRKAWEEQVGFSYDPAYLIIESVQLYPFAHINHAPLIELSRLSGMIRRDYKTPAKNVNTPTASNWKGQKKKIDTMKDVLSKLDAWSKKTLTRNLAGIPKYLHHNVYDAVGLGLWQIQKIKIELSKKAPQDKLKPKATHSVTNQLNPVRFSATSPNSKQSKHTRPHT